MKKYIIPAVDVTAMHVETSVLLNSVPVIDDPNKTVTDGDQLTRGWNANDWMTTDTDE